MELAVNMPAQEPQPGQACSLQLAELLLRHPPGADGADALEDVDQVDGPAVGQLSGLHRAAADEDRRDVEAHAPPSACPGTILSQLGMQTMRVEAVGGDHRLHAVGDELAAGEGVLHAEVPHDDAVVHGDGVELEGDAARLAYRLLDDPPDLLQVGVAGHDVGVGVGDGDERLVEVRLAADHARAPEQAAVGRSLEPLLYLVGSHDRCLSSYRRWFVLCPDYAAQIWIVRYDKRAGKGRVVDRWLDTVAGEGRLTAKATPQAGGDTVTAQEIEIHPLTLDRWPDVEALFSRERAPNECWCMWWRIPRAEWQRQKGEGNRLALKRIVESGEVPGCWPTPMAGQSAGSPSGRGKSSPRLIARRASGGSMIAPPGPSSASSSTAPIGA